VHYKQTHTLSNAHESKAKAYSSMPNFTGIIHHVTLLEAKSPQNLTVFSASTFYSGTTMLACMYNWCKLQWTCRWTCTACTSVSYVPQEGKPQSFTQLSGWSWEQRMPLKRGNIT